MSDDKSKAPDPIEDLSEGLGKLFRAAKTAVDQIPTDNAEHFMSATAGAVGRALDAVGGAIEREISGPTPAPAPPSPTTPATPTTATPPVAAAPTAPTADAGDAPKDAKPDAPPAANGADDGPRGPRVA